MAKESAVNDQITDSVNQVSETVIGESKASSHAMAQQIMAHAIGLAMQNAVHQQQQLYVLRNAATSAAVKAILQSEPGDAVKFAKEALSADDVVSTISRLKNLMDELTSSGSPRSTPSTEKEPPAKEQATAQKKTSTRRKAR